MNLLSGSHFLVLVLSFCICLKCHLCFTSLSNLLPLSSNSVNSQQCLCMMADDSSLGISFEEAIDTGKVCDKSGEIAMEPVSSGDNDNFVMKDLCNNTASEGVTDIFSIEQFNSILTGLQEPVGFPFPQKKINVQIAFMKRMKGEEVEEEIDELEERKEEIDSSRCAVLKVGASWCRACNYLTPKFSKLSSQYKDIHFLNLNTEDVPELLSDLKIKSIPSFIYFKGGRALNQQCMKEPSQISKFIDSMR
mmetsp:Transcript_12903/g.16848  ORF Transcript_12903/g.16848 Transcript_12903/m.16848 type:complete len:249 (+) Transcript_12903:111-857(+)